MRNRAEVLLGCLLLGFVGMGTPAFQVTEQDFQGLEDEMLALSKASELITINRLSLKNLRCQERIVVTEGIRKSKKSRQMEYINALEVSRRPDRSMSHDPVFTEVRREVSSTGVTDPAVPSSLPLMEKPFTGFVIKGFSLENRLENDFKKVGIDKVQGRDCFLFAFETVPEMSETRISILGNSAKLRQKGLIWVDAETYQLKRVSGKLLKRPKGCRSYEYLIDFATYRVSNKGMALPTSIELKVDLKDKSYHILQEYTDFQFAD